MPTLVEDRMAVARATVASAIAARTGMPLARASLARDGDGVGTAFLTVTATPPVGHPMETELLPLEAIMRDVELDAAGGERGDPGPIDEADVVLSEINAFVHDRLLNPNLPFAVTTPIVTDVAPINEVYGRTLLRATFAGSVAASSPRWELAHGLLFDEGGPSAALATYREYEARVGEAQAELHALDPAADAAARELAEGRLARLHAEWVGIGRKREIEEAFRIVQEEAENAGFEDERSALRQRYLAGERKRIDAPGLAYFKARLVPIAPLFTEERGPHWQRVELTADDVSRSLDVAARAAFDLPLDRIVRAAERLRTLSFEFLVCDIVRDWLDRDFFTGRYWRLDPDATPLSDGKGRGLLPTLPMRVVFVRDARAVYEGEVAAYPGTPGEAVRPPATVSRLLRIHAATAPETADRRPKALQAASSVGLNRSLDLIRRAEEQDEGTLERSATAVASVRGLVATVAPVASPAATRRPALAVATALPTAAFTSVIGARPAERGRPRVRDHRTGGGEASRPRVRDHRTRVRRPPKDRAVAVTGTLFVEADDAWILDRVSLSFTAAGEEGGERSIDLTREGATRRAFAVRLTARAAGSGRTVHAYTVVLRREDGAELDRRDVELDGAAQRRLDWTLTAQPVEIVLASPVTPTLHGYGIEIVPPCPDPDETLDWS